MQDVGGAPRGRDDEGTLNKRARFASAEPGRAQLLEGLTAEEAAAAAEMERFLAAQQPKPAPAPPVAWAAPLFL
jgi:hypothetical protein